MQGNLGANPALQKIVERAKAHPLHAAGIAAGVIALVIVMSIKSSERHEKWIADDINRVSDFADIQANAEKYFMEHEVLPDSLPELEGDPHPNPNFVRDQYLFDPGTGRLHDYKILNVRSYELCTDFHYSYDKEPGAVPLGVDENSIWRHGAGHQCFKFFVTRDPKAK